jgi:hypothetical protein
MAIRKQVMVFLLAFQELGLRKPFLNLLYHAGLKSGYFRHATPVLLPALPEHLEIRPLLRLPSKSELLETLGKQAEQLVSEADDLIQGQFRLFGGPPQPLLLSLTQPLQHWSCYETGQISWGSTMALPQGSEDVKVIWEPARLGWVFLLGRAYILTGNEDYAQCFWKLLKIFLDNNPTNLGPNWCSGQEVALRILPFVFAAQVFQRSPHSSKKQMRSLAEAVARHAERIPLTFIYARSQDNNHLLSEAAGLFTAGLALSDLPQSASWRRMGWDWFNHTLQRQIAPDGAYIQHSTNYHRLLLHLAIWMNAISSLGKECFPAASSQKLASATLWLINLQDPLSGRVPNLGHNDGSNILPLACADYNDYRPVLQTAAHAFLHQSCLPVGPWDEISLWLPSQPGQIPNLPLQDPVNRQIPGQNKLPPKIKNSVFTIKEFPSSWAVLRAVKFFNRPAHADQLHVDIWWQGHNIALDPGTYQYNASLPWQNGLSSSLVHNTLTIDDQDQMLRVSRFLWLDWAQANKLSEDHQMRTLTAEHNGYRKKGIVHQRTITQVSPVHFQIQDSLVPLNPIQQRHRFVVQWLLPDLPWLLEGLTLTLTAAYGQIKINFQPKLEDTPHENPHVQLIRAGQLLTESPLLQFQEPEKIPEILGWYSPTYTVKKPALSYRLIYLGTAPFSIDTDWNLIASPDYE